MTAHNKTTSGFVPYKTGFLRKLINRISGCRHHYQVTLYYYYEKDEDGYWLGTKYISRTIQIAVESPAAFDFSNQRGLHKFVFPPFIDSIEKKYLKNGSPRILDIQYLGYYK